MHLIGMVSWMAGLFYLVRIMVYHAMSLQKTDPTSSEMSKQYSMMEWKAYKIIIQPAVIITWSFGVTMLCLQPIWMEQGWMHVKLTLLILLTGYTHYLKGQIKKLEIGKDVFSHLIYRILNEVPTVIMVGIIFLAVFKERINFAFLLLGLATFTFLIGWGIKKANK